MEEQITQEEIDEQIAELQAEQMGGYGSPTPEKKDSQLKLFRDIINTDDSRKVANLTDKELGEVQLPVRNSLNLALFCETQHLLPLSVMFESEAEIIASTSMSRKGFLLQTIVTQIKKELKQRMPTEFARKRWLRKSTPEEVAP